jgi:hypothetical protein
VLGFKLSVLACMQCKCQKTMQSQVLFMQVQRMWCCKLCSQPLEAACVGTSLHRLLLPSSCSAVCCGCVQVYSLVVGAFRSCLSASLVEAARAWGAFSAAEADRLAPLVDSLPKR